MVPDFDLSMYGGIKAYSHPNEALPSIDDYEKVEIGMPEVERVDGAVVWLRPENDLGIVGFSQLFSHDNVDEVPLETAKRLKRALDSKCGQPIKTRHFWRLDAGRTTEEIETDPSF